MMVKITAGGGADEGCFRGAVVSDTCQIENLG